MSMIMGFGNMFYPCYMGKKSSVFCWHDQASTNISVHFSAINLINLIRNTFILNLIFIFYLTCFNCKFPCRFLVTFLSLLSLEYVAVSFTETVKSSAPIFTVFISWFLVGEKNGIYVKMSLLPIMLGLMMCSTYKVSFNAVGFLAALATNVAEWFAHGCFFK